MRELFLVAALASLSVAAAADETVPEASVPVNVLVTVEAMHSKEVPTLAPQDFMVYQGKNRVAVSKVVPLENARLELFVLLDDAAGSSVGSQLNDVRAFIASLPANTAVGIGYMRNGTVQMEQNLTTDHDQAAKRLRLPLSDPGALASPFISLSDLIKRWPSNQARREVVMVSSGVDPLGGSLDDPYLNSAIDDAQRNGIVVYTIYTPGAGHAGHSFFRANWGQNHLSQLSEETGGESYFLGLEAPVAFAPYLKDVSERLEHQYLVTILAKPGMKSGFQTFKFTTEVPHAEILHPSKVFVPAAQ